MLEQQPRNGSHACLIHIIGNACVSQGVACDGSVIVTHGTEYLRVQPNKKTLAASDELASAIIQWKWMPVASQELGNELSPPR